MRSFFEKQGCAVVLAPFDVRLNASFHYETAKHIVQPDLLVVCDKQKITEKSCDGPPDLTIEVLSPSTALKDRNEKYNLY
ncbi:Uma2 family endonuclease [Anoxybacteroides amylolyticum]|uniref:Uma2 family endonuclease n=1 Tax=Anoxybacteroides amylolyticum TaxID=294699 RepID=UPI00082AAA77